MTSDSSFHFRFDQDNDDNTSSDTHAAWTNGDGSAIAEDTAGSWATSTPLRIRAQVRNNGGETDSFLPTIYGRVKSPPGSWFAITNTSSDIDIEAVANVAQGLVTTRQLTAQSTGWDFAAGRMIEDSETAATPTSMTAWTYTEWEWSIQGTTGDLFEMKVTDNGSDFTTYTNYIEVTFTASSLTLTAPTNVTLATGVNPGTTTPDYTFDIDEYVVVTDGTPSAWTLTVISTDFTSAGAETISATNVYLRTNNNLTTEPTKSDPTTNLTETNYTSGIAINTAQEILSGNTSADGAYNIQPTFFVVIPPETVPTDYTADFLFTVA